MSHKTPTREETLAFARELIEFGVPVIVCKPNAKDDEAVPIVAWRNITNAAQCRPMLDQFEYGKDALALIGGYGIDLIDVDTKTDPPGSIAPFGEFEHFGVTRTPSGGWHYVVASTGLRKKTEVEIDGQPVGDYVGGTSGHDSRMLGFLPGSVRPKYGDVMYGFEEPWDVEGAVCAEPDPQVLATLDKAGVGQEEEREVFIDDSPPRDPSLGVHPYARAAIAGELQRLDDLPRPWAPGSYWDDTTFEVACQLLRFANSGWTGYTEDDALADLLRHAPSDDQWGEREHNAKWRQAKDAVGDAGRRDPNDPASDFDVVEDEGNDEDEHVRAEQFPTLDLVALLDPDRPPRRWLWDGLIPAGDSASVVAPGGTGKSLLVLSLCLAAVSGRPEFIGRSLDFGGRVLYVDMENSEDDWAERLRDLGWTQESARTIAGRFLPLSLPPLRGLDTEEGARQLRGILTARGIGEGDLLVLDSMQRVTEGEENSNDTLRNLYNLTSAWLKARKVTVVRTDNTGWDEGRERGASSKRDDVGYSLLLKPVDRRSGRFSLVNTKHRSKGRSDALDFTRTTDLDGRLHWQAVSPVETSVDLDFAMPRHMADTLGVVAMLTDAKGANYEGDLIASQTALQLVPGRNDTKRNGLELLVTDGYLHKDAIPLASGEPSKRQGYRLTDKGRAWVAEQGAALADRQAELATRVQQ